MRILYANRDRDSVIFDDALKDLVGRHADRLELHHHFDADGGYLDAEAIAAFLRRRSTPTSTSAGRRRSWTWSRRPCSAWASPRTGS
jgi:ferredoxin-NADP reductase